MAWMLQISTKIIQPVRKLMMMIQAQLIEMLAPFAPSVPQVLPLDVVLIICSAHNRVRLQPLVPGVRVSSVLYYSVFHCPFLPLLNKYHGTARSQVIKTCVMPTKAQGRAASGGLSVRRAHKDPQGRPGGQVNIDTPQGLLSRREGWGAPSGSPPGLHVHQHGQLRVVGSIE